MTRNHLRPITRDRHEKKFWRRFTSFDFAKSIFECSVAEAELFPVAAAFPTVFQETDTGIELVALFSLCRETPTPFVSTDGAWLAPYVPSALRCPPFLIEPQVADSGRQGSQPRLMVDESLGLITDDSQDEPFFDASGALTAELQKVSSFLQAREVSLNKCRKLCNTLLEFSILTHLDPTKNCGLPNGILGVDQGRLEKLSESQMARLAHSGALRIVHAHQMSMSHLFWLERAQKPKRSLRGISNQRGLEKTKGFLSAIAKAQQNEGLLADSCRVHHATL